MTRRSSVRAQARRNYRELAQPSAATPDPSPQARGEKKETKLTKRVRALYENSAVPVREIARLAGVSERTIYTYVIRHDWKRRHRVAARDEAVARANRGRALKPSPGFAPVKGAGSRFIRREDKDKPVAVGLKATDPAAARLAAARCGEAARLASIAQAKAEAAQRAERLISAIDFTNVALKNLREHREACAGKRASALGDRIESTLIQVVESSLKQWDALMEKDHRGAIGTS